MVDAIIVGLGNPGKEYAHTRHNVGEEAVALLATRAGVQLKAGRDKALVAESRLCGKRVVLAFPITYMNESGQAVGALMRRHRVVEPGQLIIVHDELDLPVGAMKVKVGGGLAGHNGLRSITQHLHTQDYIRVRIGVGKPRSKEHGADHVLSRVPKADRETLDVMVQRAADAVEAILADGVDAAMAKFNGL
ncbi:MAG: aminoacyl-tRNA hydrolase [Actinomycetota bacterium]|nr:aminoacyl-tRNA hydrolase [Actinomycetota bacterium]